VKKMTELELKKMTELELKLTRALMDMVRQHCAATPDLDDLVTADFNCMSCDGNAINLLCGLDLAVAQRKRKDGGDTNCIGDLLTGVYKLEFWKLDEAETGVIPACQYAYQTGHYPLWFCRHRKNDKQACSLGTCPFVTDHVEASENESIKTITGVRNGVEVSIPMFQITISEV